MESAPECQEKPEQLFPEKTTFAGPEPGQAGLQHWLVLRPRYGGRGKGEVLRQPEGIHPMFQTHEADEKDMVELFNEVFEKSTMSEVESTWKEYTKNLSSGDAHPTH